MTESCAVKIAFDAQQQVTDLKIISSLDTTNELGEAAIKTIVWNIQIAVGPRAAEIRADIKSRPVVGRYDDGSRRRFRGHVGGLRGNAQINCNKRHTSKKERFHCPAPERIRRTHSNTTGRFWLLPAEHSASRKRSLQ